MNVWQSLPFCLGPWRLQRRQEHARVVLGTVLTEQIGGDLGRTLRPEHVTDEFLGVCAGSVQVLQLFLEEVHVLRRLLITTTGSRTEFSGHGLIYGLFEAGRVDGARLKWRAGRTDHGHRMDLVQR